MDASSMVWLPIAVQTGIDRMPVRIIGNPYFGAIGKVHSLPVDLEETETESKVRVLEVLLNGGTIVTVPRANVEIIEE